MTIYIYEVAHTSPTTPYVYAGMQVNGGTVRAVAFYPALRHAEITDQLAEALEGLLMEQNGPPLARRATLWHRAIEEAKEALGKYEEIKQ